MDEASRLIAELQQKLAQLDHKVWLYRQDMACEFKKYTDDLLRDVPDDVSDMVNKAIAESLKSYPSLDVGSKVANPLGGPLDKEPFDNRTDDGPNTESGAIARPVLPDQGPESPLGPPNAHEREQEFQGLFTPSYLPLLDSVDRNERRPSSISLSPASESEAIGILARERAAEPTSQTSSSAPSPSSLPSRKPPTPPRRRSADEASTNSDQSDIPIRRSALRRSSNATKLPQSPRHVRFEFAGEEFPTTSSPKLESPAHEHVEKIPIILGNGEDMDYGVAALHEEEVSESPPRKRISSSEALRLLSRGPIEDDGTQWTEVIAPPDGSASVTKAEGDSSDDSEDEESLSMRPMTVREAAARSNGHTKRSPSPKFSNSSSNQPDPRTGSSQAPKANEMREGDDNKTPDVADEEGALADLAPLQPVKAHTSAPAISAAELQDKYNDKSKTVATKPSGRPWFVLPDGTDLKDLPESKATLELVHGNDYDEGEDDLFEFDEAARRPQKLPEPERDSEPDSPASETAEGEPPESISKYATSPARPILSPSTNSSANASTNRSTNTAPKSSTTAAPQTQAHTQAPAPTTTSTNTITTPHRANSSSSSYHPFNTPIVSEAIHAQAASLGHVQSFVGSVKDGLDEDALRSFRLGVGSLRSGSGAGAAPRSLSEKMAFDDAMEAAAAAAREREREGRERGGEKRL